MKTLILRFALQILLMALDGPIRRALNMLIDSYEVEGIPSNEKRKRVAGALVGEAGRRGLDMPERVANLAIEAELVRRRGTGHRYAPQ